MAKQTITQDEVVTAWLEAESTSPRFKKLLDDNTTDVARTIYSDDVTKRMDLLVAARGSQVSKFPWKNVTWERISITRDQLGDYRTCPGLPWLAFTEGTRSLKAAAAWISKQPQSLNPHIHVAGVQENITNSQLLPPIIAYVATNGCRVLLEGHVRAVAYYLSEVAPSPLPILLGTPSAPEIMAPYDPGHNLSEIRELFLKEES